MRGANLSTGRAEALINNWGGNCEYHRHALVGGAILCDEDMDDQACLAQLYDAVTAVFAEIAALRVERDDMLRRHDEHKRNLLDGLDRYEEQVQTLERERDAARAALQHPLAHIETLNARVAAAERML